MGEYTTVSIYKEMIDKNGLNAFNSNKFNEICWRLFDLKDDFKATENLYREINFVNEGGHVFNMNMRFINKDGSTYQTNDGVLGVDELPNLRLDYKYKLPDFWVAVLKPSEFQMDSSGFISAEISGSDIRHRMASIQAENGDKDPIFDFYRKSDKFNKSISDRVDLQDLIHINIGHIFYVENQSQKESARIEITKQRKSLAERIIIPHWRK